MSAVIFSFATAENTDNCNSFVVEFFVIDNKKLSNSSSKTS